VPRSSRGRGGGCALVNLRPQLLPLLLIIFVPCGFPFIFRGSSFRLAILLGALFNGGVGLLVFTPRVALRGREGEYRPRLGVFFVTPIVYSRPSFRRVPLHVRFNPMTYLVRCSGRSLQRLAARAHTLGFGRAGRVPSWRSDGSSTRPRTRIWRPGLSPRRAGASRSVRVPREVISSLKEYAIRKVQGRIEPTSSRAQRRDVLGDSWRRLGVTAGTGRQEHVFRVIARVRRPQSGRVVVRGLVVAAPRAWLGFHGELTGAKHHPPWHASRFLRGGRWPRIPAIAASPSSRLSRRPVSELIDGHVGAASLSRPRREVDPTSFSSTKRSGGRRARFKQKCNDRMSHFRERAKLFFSCRTRSPTS